MTDVERRQWRMRRVLNRERADCLPLTCNAIVQEYRPDLYHLGEMERVEKGQVKLADDGKHHYTADGGRWGLGNREVFRDAEDVLRVDLKRYPIETVGPEMLGAMRQMADAANQRGFAVAWHYGTLVTRATIEFDWEPFLTAAALSPERFGGICAHFAQASLAVIRGWCQTPGIEYVIIHDDIAATRGPILSPEWYRRYAFPWYKRMFDTVHEAGKKVLYISDGNYLPVLDDIRKTGPDGLYIESTSMDPGEFMDKAGPEYFFLLKTNARHTDIGTPEDVRQELLRLRDLHARFPGIYMYQGGNLKPECHAAFAAYYREYLVYA
jgi:hypothetical protein